MKTEFKTSLWDEKLLFPDILEIRLNSWRHFNNLVCDVLLDDTDYIWRGQCCDNWGLEPSIERELKNKNLKEYKECLKDHLQRFQLALRGRRGANPIHIKKDDENEWWALGQHQGLVTPLLDWTKSPFVALYFAFSKNEHNQTDFRVVFALHQKKVEEKSKKLDKKDSVQFVNPFIGDNPRLINQNGLFTKSPDKILIEDWIKSNIDTEIKSLGDYERMKEEGRGIRFNLIKIYIPNEARFECLRALSRMNINHLTLFPDAYGASEYCNKCLNIPFYDVNNISI